MARLHEKKEKSSAEKAVDEKSRILLFKLINRGILETINGVISTGKESIVLHSRGENPDKGITSCEVAIKVFKTTITEFQNRVQYIIGDPILEQTGKLSRQNPKLTIPLWAEKEMHNLVFLACCLLSIYLTLIGVNTESYAQKWNCLSDCVASKAKYIGDDFYWAGWSTGTNLKEAYLLGGVIQPSLAGDCQSDGEVVSRVQYGAR